MKSILKIISVFLLICLLPISAVAQAICQSKGEEKFRSAGFGVVHFDTVKEACEQALTSAGAQREYLGAQREQTKFDREKYICRFKVKPIGSSEWTYPEFTAPLDCVQSNGSWSGGYCDPAPSCSCLNGCCDASTTAGDANPGKNLAGNPLEIAFGVKVEDTTDWTSPKDSRFLIARKYASGGYSVKDEFDFGLGWSGNWSYLYIQEVNQSAETLLYQPGNTRTLFGDYWENYAPKTDGSALELTYIGSTEDKVRFYWKSAPTAENDNYRLTDGTGKEITLSVYDFPQPYNYGHFVKKRYPSKIVWPGGYQITFDRDTKGRVQTVTDNKGQRADYTWLDVEHDPMGLSGVVSDYEPKFVSVLSKIEIDSSFDGSVFTPTVKIEYSYASEARLRGFALDNAEVTDLPTGTVLKSTTYHYHPTNESPVGVPQLVGVSDGRLDQDGDPFQYSSFSYSETEIDPQTRTNRAVGTEYADGAMSFAIEPDLNSTAPAGGMKVTNALGKETLYSYDWIAGQKRPVQIDGVATQSCLATTKSLGYTPNSGAPQGYLYERVEQNGSKTTYERNARGLVLTKTEDADGVAPRVTSYTWHADLRLPLTRTTTQLVESFIYTSEGLLTSYTQTDNLTGSPSFGATRTWTYTYTTLASGLSVLTSVDGPGLAADGVLDVTTYDYDADGNLINISDPNGLITELLNLNEMGQPTLVRSADGVEWGFAYDQAGRVTSTTLDPNGTSPKTASYTYDIVGQMLAFTSFDGHTTTFDYDQARRLVKVTNPLSEVVDYEYDLVGNRTKSTYSTDTGVATFWENTEYDELGRILKTVGAMGQDWDFSHDVEDNLHTITDPIDLQITQNFDALNRLSDLVDRDSNSTFQQHDDSDQITEYTDPRNIDTIFTYNGFGDLISEVSQDRGTLSYSYNTRSLASSMTDGNGVVSNYAYDNGGRLISRDFPSDSTLNESYSYGTVANADPASSIGKLRQITDGSGSITRAYDQATGHINREDRVIGGETYPIKYGFDAEGDLTWIEYPSGRRIDYTRDAENRPTRVTQQMPGGPVEDIISNAQYLPSGPMSVMDYADGAGRSFTYDLSYRLLGIHDALGASDLYKTAFTWTARDNIASITDVLDPAENQSFGYDNREHLDMATGAWGTLDYAYDAVGNRSSRSLDTGSGPQTDIYNYPSVSNRLTSISMAGSGTRSFTHDAAGNVTYDNRSGGGYGYSYDAKNRMASFSINGVVQAEYEYNALGQQVLRRLTQAGQTLHVVHDLDGNRIAEYEYDPVLGGSTLLREYVWMDGVPVAVIEGGITYYIRTDHIGRPVFATDGLGTKIWEATYLPFGGVHTSSGANSDLRFPGQWFQSESGLHQNWMRDYDPTTGRYIQADPLGLIDGPSVYGYALQNPGRYTDPRGEAVCGGICIAAAVVVAGVAIDYIFDDGCYTFGDFFYSLAANISPSSKVTTPYRAYRNYKKTKHAANRHVTRAKYPNKSKYKKPAQYDKIVDQTLKSPDRIIRQGNRTRYEKDYGRVIGTRGERTHVTVVDNRTGKIVTSYPTN